MSDTKIGLYDSDGACIIEYNQFNSFGIQFMYISTGFGSTGRWTISIPGKYFGEVTNFFTKITIGRPWAHKPPFRVC